MKFKTNPLRLTKILLLSGILIVSCTGEYFDLGNMDENAKFAPEFAVHLAHANISFKDVMPEDETVNQFIEVNDDGYLEIYYQQDLFSLTATEQVAVPDQEFENILSLSETQLAQFNDQNIDFGVDKDYDYNFAAPEGMHLDSITFNQGEMHIIMNSEWDIDITILLEIPGIKDELGNVLTLDIVDLANNPIDTVIQLNGKTINLTDNETTFNRLVMDYGLTLSQEANNTSELTDQIAVNVTLSDIGFESVTGYFGNRTQKIATNTFPLGFGGSALDAEINFENPQFNIFYRNSFGLPVQFGISSMYTLGSDNQTTNISLPAEMSPLVLDNTEIDDVLVYDTVSINNTNSNLITELGNFPKSLTFGGTVVLNKDVDDDQYYVNELPGNGLFDISAEFRLPVSANFRFALQDTIPFEALANITNSNFLDEIEIKLGINNGFPIDLGVQVYFANETYALLDSIFDDPDNPFSIEGSLTGEPVPNVETIAITSEKVQKILTTKNLIFKVEINSTGFEEDQYVRITDQYEIGFDVATKVGLSISTSGLSDQ